MRAENRLKHILKTAEKDGFVSTSVTAEILGVSIETVRRDINQLCSEGKVKKVRGGAVPVKLSLRREAEYMVRKKDNIRAKNAIGAFAASLIRDNMTIIFDCGTSVQQIAANLSGVKNVTFITNHIPTASLLLEKFSADELTGRLIIIGGMIDTKNYYATGGNIAEEIQKYYADIAFVACTSVSAESVSMYNPAESHYSGHMMKRSSMSVLVGESEKFGKNSVCRFASPTDFDAIVTDDLNPIPNDILEEISRSETELHIVSVTEPLPDPLG